MTNSQIPLLSVSNLQVGFRSQKNAKAAMVVHGIDFSIGKGEVLALVGESGSGKSVSAMSIIHLLPQPSGVSSADKIIYHASDGVDIHLENYSVENCKRVRGREIGVIFQDPSLALNPVMRVDKQIEEVFKLHRSDLTPDDYERETITLLNNVGIKAAEQRAKSYPHQLSGGMRQRVMIAMALAAKPKLLIADEPTTALDVTIQAQILGLLQDLQQQYGMAILFISHDLAVVRAIADRVAVMYQGKIVETNDCETLINHPQHDYTKKLLDASWLLRTKVNGDGYD